MGLVVAGAAGCAGDFNPARDVVSAVGAGPQVAPTPDFVAQSRPDAIEYLPVGSTTPERATPARTAEEVKAAEAELDALRARNEAAGAAASRLGGTPAPEPVTLPAKRSPSTKTR